jgi:hypothetical protein
VEPHREYKKNRTSFDAVHVHIGNKRNPDTPRLPTGLGSQKNSRHTDWYEARLLELKSTNYGKKSSKGPYPSRTGRANPLTPGGHDEQSSSTDSPTEKKGGARKGRWRKREAVPGPGRRGSCGGGRWPASRSSRGPSGNPWLEAGRWPAAGEAAGVGGAVEA